MTKPISREAISELLRQQERELPLHRMQPADDPDEAERALRREWRRERRRQERQQEPERCGDDWNRWCDQRIAAAIAAERAAYAQEHKAFVRHLETAFGEVLAQLMHDLRADMCDRLSGFAAKVTELEAVWRTSLNTSAAEIADLQRELAWLLKVHNDIRRDLAMPTVNSAPRPIAN